MHRLGLGSLLALALILGPVGCAPTVPGPVGSVLSATPPATGSAATGSAPAPPITLASPPSPDRIAGWGSDLDRLVPAMAALHPDLFHDTSEADLDRFIGGLRSQVATASDDALMVGVTHAVALVSAHGRDSHTGLFPWSPTSHFPVHSLPLRLWLFPDGIHVVAALAPYTDLVGARIESVAGHPAADVTRALEPIIPRDNDTTIRLLTPRFLLIPEVLHGLGLLGAVGPVDLGIVDASGTTRTVSIRPIPMTDYNAWAGPYGLFLPADPKVMYLSRMDEPLWWTKLADGSLFVQYNRVDFIDDATVAQLAAQASAPEVTRVIVDIRHNYGGEVRALAPIVDALDTPAVDRPGHLFLITGRNTYSAASMFAGELQARTGVTIVGEPMGGSPNPWGDAEEVLLPWSGLSVDVATLLEVATTSDDVRLGIEPDVPVPLRFVDWAAGRDAALDAIRARP